MVDRDGDVVHQVVEADVTVVNPVHLESVMARGGSVSEDNEAR